MEKTISSRVKTLAYALDYEPSNFQLDIWNEIDTGTENLLLRAVAGSGKTTVIVEGAKLISSKEPTAFAAFNKAIVEDLTGKLPSHVNTKTMHSFGMTAVRTKGNIKLDNFKYNKIIKTKLDEWDETYEYGQCVKRLVELARQNLLFDKDTLWQEGDRHDVPYTDGMEAVRALECLEIGDMMSRTTIDFTDMIYLPVKYQKKYAVKKYKYIFVDEVQDLNRAQQELLKLMLHEEGRIIAVGDPNQAIYGFAGADARSFERMKEMFNCKMMPLSVNYRCGKKSVEMVEHIVPHYEVNPNAIEGEVVYSCDSDEVQYGDMILCRITMPLVSLCFKYLAQERKAFVKGRDIGAGLIKLIEQSKTTKINVLQVFLETELNDKFSMLRRKNPDLFDKEIRRMSTYVFLEEKIKVIELIIEKSNPENCDYLMDIIETIFKDKSPGIMLSTIHRVKGLEADNVYI